MTAAIYFEPTDDPTPTTVPVTPERFNTIGHQHGAVIEPDPNGSGGTVSLRGVRYELAVAS